MDSIIDSESSCETKIKKVLLSILVKLMQFRKENIYIPGETLQIEQQRVKLMQFGIVPLCLHLILNSTENKELPDMAAEHLCMCYPTPELEWTLELMGKLDPDVLIEYNWIFANVYRKPEEDATTTAFFADSMCDIIHTN